MKHIRTFLILFVAIFFAVGYYDLWANLNNHRNRPGLVYWHGDHDSNKIALTFDDGPNEPYTSQILDLLKKYDVKATFFLVGKNVEKDPATVQAIVKAGHAVGNHTYSHSELILKTGKGVRSQIQRTELAILNAAGVQTNLFRPPFGIDDPLTFRQSKKMGYLTVKWSVTSKDWSHPGVQRIIDNVVPRVRNGSIILMHDGRKTLGGDQSQTVEALKTILPELKERGFEFVTVPELLRAEESKEWLARASKKDLLF